MDKDYPEILDLSNRDYILTSEAENVAVAKDELFVVNMEMTEFDPNNSAKMHQTESSKNMVSNGTRKKSSLKSQ